MGLEFNILVVGGGIVGLTAALAMAQRGYTIALIDAGPLKVDSSHPDTRVYAINHASQALLQQLGVWQHLNKECISPYSKMYVWDISNGAHIDFDSRYIAASNLGTIIEESALKQALVQQIALQKSIHLFPDCPVEAIQTEEQFVRVHNQHQAWEGQLLMIADGANSLARQILKIELNGWSYNQHALVATVSVAKSHQQTAYQVFHPSGPLAFLPLADPHQCSIVWSTSPLQVKKLMGLSDQEFSEALTQAFAEKLGQAEVISTRRQFPLQMRHVKQYTGKRWLLLGDAAHTIHPLAGLGLNVGLADISSWIHCLEANSNTFFSNKVLGAYQRERKHAVWQIILLMEGFKQLFSHSVAPIVSLRAMSLNFCNGFIPIKRLFIHHACGS